MVGYLKGIIINQDLKSVIVDVSGIGYKVYTNVANLDNKKQKTTAFWIHTAVRENSIDLYGFQTKEELRFFELLLTVSGIGPKSALSILNIASLQNLRQAIVTGDTAHLIKVSGVGKKNAEKIVLELKDKLKITKEDTGMDTRSEGDALEALVSLGYSEHDAREALKRVSKDTKGASERVKAALKILSQHA